MNAKKNTYLITGATGFIGSNIVKFLLKKKKHRLYLGKIF